MTENNGTPPKITRIPTGFEYFCECGCSVKHWYNNYCANCGKKLDWSEENIETKMELTGKQAVTRMFEQFGHLEL